MGGSLFGELYADERGQLERVLGKDIVADETEWDVDGLEQRLRTAIKKAGEMALRENGGTVYMTLSGGVDSSLCLALMREELGPEARIVTFTMGGSKEHPDLHHARLAAEKFGTEHHEIIPSMEEINRAKGEFAGRGEISTRAAYFGSGDLDVYLLYKKIAQLVGPSPESPRSVIAHDGIDEIMGGYWPHRSGKTREEMEVAFRKFWKELPLKHIDNLARSAAISNVRVLWPYLDESFVEYARHIPVNERTSRKESKILLRKIARKYLPAEIIERRKRGQVGMLDVE